MSHATAFDLGTFSLEQTFDEFDAILDEQEKAFSFSDEDENKVPQTHPAPATAQFFEWDEDELAADVAALSADQPWQAAMPFQLEENDITAVIDNNPPHDNELKSQTEELPLNDETGEAMSFDEQARSLSQIRYSLPLDLNQRVDTATLTTHIEKHQTSLSYSDTLNKIKKTADQLATFIPKYNNHIQSKDANVVTTHKALKVINEAIINIQDDLDWLIPGLANRTGQTQEDASTYEVLVPFQSAITALSREVNDEVAKQFNIKRAGAGGRPDANSENAIERSMAYLGLNQEESKWAQNFVANQGGSWKEKREALSGIWAMRAKFFNTLTPGKTGKSGPDVEYMTQDKGLPRFWDQKTIYTGETGFDGRIQHTHQKHRDDQGKGVGLLFDSTFENSTNYEKAWLKISAAILNEEITPDAVKEVCARSSHPLGQFRSDIYVDITNKTKQNEYADNVKWVEKLLNTQLQGGISNVVAAHLASTNYQEVKEGTAKTHSRYTNNRNWLPDGVYDEYAVKGLPNDGQGRFVANKDCSIIYLTVTHYKPYTVKLPNSQEVNRAAFFRIV
jgi:hypothetical protein